jgi:dTDP-4-dehydrorhamnose 3,5-epimerase
MKVEPTSLPGAILINPDVFEDSRGYFMETWNSREFSAAGIDAVFVQDNMSQSARHTLRGLHYQIRQPQGKLVRVVRGEVFDVAVDLRRSSPTFGKHAGVFLSADNKCSFWVPPGFAHGFLVLSNTAEFEYKCTDYYAPEFERAIRWDDPDIGIDWPLPDGAQPLLSARDEAAVSFAQADTYT